MVVVGVLLVVTSYLLGSISFGLVAAARRGVDLRSVGSGNVGATNVGRALGKRAGRVVLVLDALKGVVPVLVARLLFEWGALSRLGVAPGGGALSRVSPEEWVAATAVAAVLGHLLPIWHGFRGGKGVATTAGVMLAAVPLAGLAMAVTYVLLLKLTRRSSVGSLVGSVVALGATAALTGSSVQTAMAAVLVVLVFVRHADNLARLAQGKEPPS